MGGWVVRMRGYVAVLGRYWDGVGTVSTALTVLTVVMVVVVP